ncbi:MAG: hypothetical protein JW774_13290 [Candidatus Aureabacteria bacterium]|nr:hypothetical protein [Candidatus Auribacterota bacterium]
MNLPQSCKGSCSQCTSLGNDPNKPGGSKSVPPWRIWTGAFGLFVCPLILALLGAVTGHKKPGTQFLGALAGLGMGLVLSVGFKYLFQWLKKRNDNT